MVQNGNRNHEKHYLSGIFPIGNPNHRIEVELKLIEK